MTRPNPKIDLPLLDRVRWLSAAIVGVGHALVLFFNPVPLLGNAGASDRIVTYIAELRQPAVVIFFVLSGYLVGGSVLARKARFSWPEYFIQRFSRIYIVLIPALLLTVGLDVAGIHVFSSNAFYTLVRPEAVLGAGPVISHYRLADIAASVTSLENFVGDPIGSNGPLWSLGYEWVFYFLFPTLVIATRNLRTSFAIALVAVAPFLLWWRHPSIGIFWFIWIAGAYASVALPFRLPRPAVWLAGAATVVSLAASPFFDQRIADVVIGASFALFLVDGTAATVTRSYAVDRRLAGFSYSFYVVHLPVMVFLAGIANNFGLLPISGVPISAANLFYVLVLIVCSGSVAFLFGEVFEGWTERLRGALRRRYLALTGQAPAGPK